MSQHLEDERDEVVVSDEMDDGEMLDVLGADGTDDADESDEPNARPRLASPRVEGYELWQDGLYAVPPELEGTAVPRIDRPCPEERKAGLVRICPCPLWIERVGQVLDTDDTLVELKFYDAVAGEVRSLWCDRLQISSKQKLLELAARGLPVTDVSVQIVSKYLVELLVKIGSSLPRVLFNRRAGRVSLPEGHGFLLGKRWVGPPDTRVELDPRVTSSLVDYMDCAGSERAWFEVLYSLSKAGPQMRVLIFSTFAPMLLYYVGHRTFIIHHWGDSSTGKSAVLKYALSAFGDPNKLIRTFNSTRKAFVETFSLVTDLPVGFDELQASSDANIATIAYDITQQRGRARAGQTGGLQRETEDWLSVVRMTGEEPIIGKNGRRDLGGQANRVLQIGTPMMESEMASSLHRWMEKRSFGWGGLRFAERLIELVNSPGGQVRLVQTFEHLKKEIAEKVDNVLAAQAGNYAVIGLAMALANEWFFEQDFDDAVEFAAADCVAAATAIREEEAREPIRVSALQALHDHMNASRRFWLDRSVIFEETQLRTGTFKNVTGVITSDEIWLIQREANRILEGANIPPLKAWVDLARIGVLKRPRSSIQNGTYAASRRIGKFPTWVYVLDRRACPDVNPFYNFELIEEGE